MKEPDYRAIAVTAVHEKQCATCWRDRPTRHGDPGNGCPIILAAQRGEVPAEWKWNGARWRCRIYKDEGIRPREPAPDQVPGQLAMWEVT